MFIWGFLFFSGGERPFRPPLNPPVPWKRLKKKLSNSFTQDAVRLILHGQVVVEKKMKREKLTDRQQGIRKAHLNFVPSLTEVDAVVLEMKILKCNKLINSLCF